MACCGRQRTLMREGAAATRVDQRSGAAGTPTSISDSGGVWLRYIGGVSALVSGPSTRRAYRFSVMQPTQRVDTRDATAMLRTRLFVQTW
jgi:hypothetical protein